MFWLYDAKAVVFGLKKKVEMSIKMLYVYK